MGWFVGFSGVFKITFTTVGGAGPLSVVNRQVVGLVGAVIMNQFDKRYEKVTLPWRTKTPEDREYLEDHLT